MKKQLLDITGMSCSACSSRIEKVVNRMQGVEQMSVNLLKNNAHVTFDESVVDEKAIIARIEKLSANIDTLTRVLQERLVMQFPYAQQ